MPYRLLVDPGPHQLYLSLSSSITSAVGSSSNCCCHGCLAYPLASPSRTSAYLLAIPGLAANLPRPTHQILCQKWDGHGRPMSEGLVYNYSGTFNLSQDLANFIYVSFFIPKFLLLLLNFHSRNSHAISACV